MSKQNKLELLLKWFDANEIEWDKDAIEIKESNGSFGVYAKKNLKKDTTIVKVPKENILSTKTSGIANLIEEAQIEGGCALALVVMYELAQKEKSPWFGYLQSLPDQENLPMIWPKEDRDLFKGTEMEQMITSNLADLFHDYEDLIIPLVTENAYVFENVKENYSFEKFVKVSSLIASRSFEIDAFHDTALVPFADVFNHRTENEHVHFETEYEVCDFCGVPDYCEHQYMDLLDEHKDNDHHEHGEDCHHSEEEWEDEESEDEEKDTELPDLEELENQGVDFYDNNDDEEEEKDSCDLVLSRIVKKGEEIFNTYGDLPNVALLNKYGFCHDDNKNNYVSVGENALVDCCLSVSTEIVKEEGVAEKDAEKIAIERTRPRWEFFLMNEPILCGEEDQDDGCQDGCCGGGDDHDHDHSGHGHDDHDHDGHAHDDHAHAHEHGEHGHDEHEHEHAEDGTCCNDDEEEDESESRPYFINYEGLFEDKLMCLLHIMFVDEATFATFTKDIKNAIAYFDNLAKNEGNLKEVKIKVYRTCLALVEYRRSKFLTEDGKWKSIKEELKERDETYDNRRKYFALTCRIGEKKIIERSIKYYSDLLNEYLGIAPKTTNKKKSTKKNKKK